jgi:hypothetical protein
LHPAVAVIGFQRSPDGKLYDMTSIPAPSVPLSQVGRAAHDIGLAGLLGGNLFGRLALHPSVTRISDKAERGQVVNTAWRRYGAVNSVSLLAVVSGWFGARLNEAAPRQLSPAERRLAVAKDALVGAVALSGLATAIEGVRFARQAPGGAVPLEDGNHTAAGATQAQERMKRRLNVLGRVSLAAELGLTGVNAALNQQSFRRPPSRRLLPWRRP